MDSVGLQQSLIQRSNNRHLSELMFLFRNPLLSFWFIRVIQRRSQFHLT